MIRRSRIPVTFKRREVARPMRSLARLVLIALIASTLSGCLSGGVGNFVRSTLIPSPNPQSPRLVKKRQASVARIGDEFQRIEAANTLTAYAESSHDYCYEGQNDFKVSDGYAHQCTYRITRFYGFDGDFKQIMIGFETRLFAGGWSPFYPDETRPLQKLLDEYIHPSAPRLVSALPTPTSGYGKAGSRLFLGYGERKTTDFLMSDFAQNASGTHFGFYDVKHFQDVPALYRRITKDHEFVLVVSIERIYFEN